MGSSLAVGQNQVKWIGMGSTTGQNGSKWVNMNRDHIEWVQIYPRDEISIHVFLRKVSINIMNFRIFGFENIWLEIFNF